MGEKPKNRRLNARTLELIMQDVLAGICDIKRRAPGGGSGAEPQYDGIQNGEQTGGGARVIAFRRGKKTGNLP